MKRKDAFNSDSLLFPYVSAFSVFMGGINSFVRPDNPMNYKKGDTFGLECKFGEDLSIDLSDIQHNVKNREHLNSVIVTMTAPMIISSYSEVEKYNDNSEIFELFRHMRNACAHGNKFYFRGNQPSRPAKWKELIINHEIKGEENPLYGTTLLFNFISAGDIVYFLLDVQKHIDTINSD